MSRLRIEYENDFGNIVKTEETFDENVLSDVGEGTLPYMIERFRAFLIYAQFSEKSINEIMKFEDED